MLQPGYSRSKEGKCKRSVEHWVSIFIREKQTMDPFSKARAVSFLCKTQLKRRIPWRKKSKWKRENEENLSFKMLPEGKYKCKGGCLKGSL